MPHTKNTYNLRSRTKMLPPSTPANTAVRTKKPASDTANIFEILKKTDKTKQLMSLQDEQTKLMRFAREHEILSIQIDRNALLIHFLCQHLNHVRNELNLLQQAVSLPQPSSTEPTEYVDPANLTDHIPEQLQPDAILFPDDTHTEENRLEDEYDEYSAFRFN